MQKKYFILTLLISLAGYTQALQVGDTLYVKSDVAAVLSLDRKQLQLEPHRLYKKPLTGAVKSVMVAGQALKLEKGSVFVNVKRDLSVQQFQVAATSGGRNDILTAKEIHAYHNYTMSFGIDQAYFYLNEFPDGFFKSDVLSIISELSFVEMSKMAIGQYEAGNFLRAADLLLSLKHKDSIKNLPGVLNDQIATISTAVASRLYALARASLHEQKPDIALYLTDMAHAIMPSGEISHLRDSLHGFKVTRVYSREIAASDSLLAQHKFIDALTHLRNADRILPSKILTGRIDSLDRFVQDSLIQFAYQNDRSNVLVMNRIRPYSYYLDLYPDGLYTDRSEMRLKKLNQLANNQRRYFFTYGQNITYTKNFGAIPAHNFYFGRFTEVGLFGFTVRFNQDALVFKNKKMGFSTSDGDIQVVKAENISGYRDFYIERSSFMFNYSRLIGRPGKVQYFIVIQQGFMGNLRKWDLAYKVPFISTGNFDPATAKPVYVSIEPDGHYELEVDLMINFKIFTAVLGYSNFQMKYSGFTFGIGASF